MWREMLYYQMIMGLRGPESTKKSHKKVAQIPIIPVLITLPSLSQQHLWPQGELTTKTSPMKEKPGLLYKWFYTICCHWPKVDGSNTATSYWVPWKKEVKENPPSGQNFENCTWLFILYWKAKWSEVKSILMYVLWPVFYLE